MPIENLNPNVYDSYDADPNEPDIDMDMPFQASEEDNPDLIEEHEDGSVTILDSLLEDEGIPDIANAPFNANLVEYFPESDLNTMAQDFIKAWEADDQARDDWKQTYIDGLALMGMKIEKRTDPFDGATGVYHPLLAEAVVQFQAQAYKELLPASGPVLTKVLGSETPERLDQAVRVQDYMNYLVMDVMTEYDPNMDQLLFYLPLAGSAFKKTYFDPLKKRTTSKFVMAEHLTVPYGTTSLEEAVRVTHDFVLSGNDLLKLQASGFYSDYHKEPQEISAGQGVSQTDEAIDELEGESSGYYIDDENYTILEAHLNLDHELLNAESGVVRPYIMTVDKESQSVLSIYRNYKEEDENEAKIEYFVHYKFLPGLGFYGFGLIHMIGSIASSATAILRQLIDAGTFSNLPGGLKARGMKIEGGDDPIAPGEWRDVDIPTGNLKEAIFPMPYKEPSTVLVALLGTLVEAGQRFASTADMQVGDTGSQAQPVGTTIAILERGTKVMSSIHKRLYKSQKEEFRILARLIQENMTKESYPYMTKGSDGQVMQSDFDDRVDVLPVSDPNIFSMAQRVLLAQQQLQMAQTAPEIHNMKEAFRRMYKAMGIDDVETLIQPDEKPQPLTPMQEHMRLMMNKKLIALPQMNHQVHIEAHIIFLQSPFVMSSAEFAANIVQDIMSHISLLAKQTAEQAQQQGIQGKPVDLIELELLTAIMPRLVPPNEDPLAKLQERQLDIDERYKTGQIDNDRYELEMKVISDTKDRISKETITRENNMTDLKQTVLQITAPDKNNAS